MDDLAIEGAIRDIREELSSWARIKRNKNGKLTTAEKVLAGLKYAKYQRAHQALIEGLIARRLLRRLCFRWPQTNGDPIDDAAIASFVAETLPNLRAALQALEVAHTIHRMRSSAVGRQLVAEVQHSKRKAKKPSSSPVRQDQSPADP